MNAKDLNRPAVFLDRDGTLVEEVDHLASVDDLVLYPFSAEAVALLKEKGFRVIVVTNQSGIGRGYFDERSMHTIHDEIQTKLKGAIDGFYYCPHLPGEGCRCRKPDFGMIEAACRDFDIDLAKSWMIGDKKIDVETGHNAGIRSAMVATGYGRKHHSSLERKPDVAADNLLEAVKAIVEATP
jgi:D-glycero-D-manno-heptose 1,7-bisphosphate phosphatase